jgi:hypothetical protein
LNRNRKRIQKQEPNGKNQTKGQAGLSTGADKIQITNFESKARCNYKPQTINHQLKNPNPGIRSEMHPMLPYILSL